MQILRTLGQYSGECSLFYYKRTPAGVYMQGPLNGGADPTDYFITNDQWSQILQDISNEPLETFRIRPGTANGPVQQNLEEIVANRTGLTTTTAAAYVAAILVNEGSMEFHFGPLGPTANTFVCLKRDM